MVGNTTAFIHGKNLLSEDGTIPSGIITMWSGASTAIPTGWLICDGSNGTPDLRNRFIVGAGSTYSVGNTGGSNTVTLSTSQMPSHNHTAALSLDGLTTSSSGAHTHNFYYNTRRDAMCGSGSQVNAYMYSGGNAALAITLSAGAHTHTISGSGSVSIGNTGSGSSHENRPPYYALCFIMKV